MDQRGYSYQENPKLQPGPAIGPIGTINIIKPITGLLLLVLLLLYQYYYYFIILIFLYFIIIIIIITIS